MDTDQGFRRVLGPFSAMSVVIGAIIGIGIFFTPQSVARSAGSAEMAMLAWTIGGVIAIFGALTFAELGSLYSRTAGQYEILRDAYGPFVGFVYVFCNATIVQAGAIAIIAYITALNFGIVVITTDGPSHAWTLGMGTVLIVLLTAANLIGVAWGAIVQNFTVVIKIVTLLAITALALMFKPEPFVPPTTTVQPETTIGLAGLLSAITITLFSYGGWQQALWVGGEIRDPQRNVPRAIIFGVLIVIATYLMVNWAYLQLLTYQGVVHDSTKALAADAVGQVIPGWGRRVVAAAIALSGFGVLNAQLLTGPRLICGMARDGRFFSIFSTVSGKLGTPVYAVLLLGFLGLALLWGMELLAPAINSMMTFLAEWRGITVAAEQVNRSGPDYIDSLTNGVVMVDSALFLLTGVALIVLRPRFQAAPNAIRMPFYPLVPVMFALGEAVVLVGAFMIPKYRDGAYIGLIWIAVAALCYWLFFRGQGKPATRNAAGNRN